MPALRRRHVLPFERPDDEDEPVRDPGARPADSSPAAQPSAQPAGPTEQAQEPQRPPQALPAHLEAMTVEHYAALCAQCAVHSQWASHIEARFHIRSAEEREALDQLWRDKLAVDEQLQEQYRWHYARHESWARGQQGE
jgi:hypothetical protein